MNQIYRKSPFWSLAGPLLAYLAIRWVVEAALMMLIILPYLPDVYAELMQMGAQSAVDTQGPRQQAPWSSRGSSSRRTGSWNGRAASPSLRRNRFPSMS